MKKISFILFVAMLLVSCGGQISPEMSKEFAGEYWMKTNIYELYDNGEIDPLPNTYWSPVSVYEDEGKLYVQTELFGEPDTVSDNQRELELYVVKHPIEETGIETGEIAPPDNAEKSYANEWIYKEKQAKPAPILVKSSSSTVLDVCKYQMEPIVLPLTNSDGFLVTYWYVSFEYKSMIKKNDIISWDVVMNNHTDEYVIYESGASENNDKLYKNTLYKR
jgi:hypothetical protein